MCTLIVASAHSEKMLSDIEKTLGSVPKLTPEQRNLLSTDGFFCYYRILRRNYPKMEAYLRISDYFFTIFGFHKYADYDSFRKVLNRYKWNKVPVKRP